MPIPCDLERFESSTFSQNGEDGVIARLFDILGTTNKYFVEFGSSREGLERNTRLLQERHGWGGLLMDCEAPPHHPLVKRERITAENINGLFAKYEVPEEFDLLSVDIDGNDYWVWQAIDARYRPRVAIIEYNACVPPEPCVVMPYDPEFVWHPQTDYFGASLGAMERLGRTKGYTLVYCDLRGVNGFFVRDDLCPFVRRSVAEVYRKPDYLRGCYFGLSRLLYPRGYRHRRDPHRKLVPID